MGVVTFSKKSKILRGRLPPEDGSDWRENPPHPAEGRCLACEIAFGSRRTRLYGFAMSPSHCQDPPGCRCSTVSYRLQNRLPGSLLGSKIAFLVDLGLQDRNFRSPNRFSGVFGSQLRLFLDFSSILDCFWKDFGMENAAFLA